MKTRRMVQTALGLGMALVTTVALAGSVSKTAEGCTKAHAVLFVSKSGDHEKEWARVRGVLTANPDKWKVVESVEPGTAWQVSFNQYDVKWTKGATAYVAHCGHGGTCNEFAEALIKIQPNLGSPHVYCGEVPAALSNPQPGAP